MPRVIYWPTDESLPEPPAFIPHEDTDGGLLRRHVAAALAAGALALASLLGYAWAHEEIPPPTAAAVVDQEDWRPPVTALEPVRWQRLFDEDVPAGALHGPPEDNGWQTPAVRDPQAVFLPFWQDHVALPVLSIDEDAWQPALIRQARIVVSAAWQDEGNVPAPPVIALDEEAWRPAPVAQVVPAAPWPWGDDGALPITLAPGVPDEDAWLPGSTIPAMAVRRWFWWTEEWGAAGPSVIEAIKGPTRVEVYNATGVDVDTRTCIEVDGRTMVEI
jgi:hypothetical protein